MDQIAWRPTIGDPTVMGWFTVFAYLVACWLCVLAFGVEKRGKPRPLRQAIPAALRVWWKHWPHPPLPVRRAILWLVLAGILLGLAINKQFDFQTLLTDVGRVLAKRGGWYAERGQVQKAFVIGVGVVALGTVVWLWWVTRRQLRDFRLPLVGVAFILAFVVIRASSFHHMDALIGFELLGLRMNWILELGGIGMIGAGAIRRLLRLEFSGADYAEGVPTRSMPRRRGH